MTEETEIQDRKVILDEAGMTQAIEQVARAVIEECKHTGFEKTSFIAIQSGGVPLAKRIVKFIQTETGIELPVGTLDISMYRDDIGMRRALPLIKETDIPFNLNNGNLILVDDVLHTGRTIRAALDALTDYGRPATIRLAVLVDRGGHEFPIRADISALTIDVPANHHIRTEWSEYNKNDAVYETASGSTEKVEA